MNNLEKYNKIFCDIFLVQENVLNFDFNKDSVDGWDSVKQLALVTALEEEFEILLDTEDILELTSYDKGLSILKKNDIDL